MFLPSERSKVTHTILCDQVVDMLIFVVLCCRSLQFEEESTAPEIPAPEIPACDLIEVQTIAEVIIPSETEFTNDDRNFLIDFITAAVDQPFLYASDNEHNYCSSNFKTHYDIKNTADVGVLVNTLSAIVGSKTFLDLIRNDEDLC